MIVAILLCLVTRRGVAAVPTFWQEIPTTEILEDSLLLQYYQRHAQRNTHKKISVLELNLPALQEKTMTVLLEGRYLNVNSIRFEPADQNTNDKKNGNEFQIWFGASEPNSMYPPLLTTSSRASCPGCPMVAWTMSSTRSA